VGYLTGRDPAVSVGNELWIFDLNSRRKWRLDSVSEPGDPASDPRTGNYGTYPSFPPRFSTWCWSPSGDRVLYRGADRHCYLTDPRGRDRLDLIRKVLPSEHSNLTLWDAYWARDGQIYVLWLAVTQDGKMDQIRYAVNPDNFEATQVGTSDFTAAAQRDLDRTTTLARAAPLLQGQGHTFSDRIVLSPDGSKLAYVAHLGGGDPDESDAVVVFDATNHTERIVVDFSKMTTKW
jgi:hypothetical protein